MKYMTCASCARTFKVSVTEALERRTCSRSCRSALMAADEVPRFWRSVQKTDTCWLWTGPCQNAGYGLFSTYDRRKVTAHRYSFSLANGPIIDGALVCHHCDIKTCVRPDHMYAGTSKDNARDAVERGRLNTNVAGNRAVLSEDNVRAIRRRYGPPRGIVGYHARFIQPRAKDLASEFGVSKETIIAIVNRRCWPNITD